MKKPTILIDKEAIRFITEDEQVNLFWYDLFTNQGHTIFHADIMRQLKRLYDECIRLNVEPDIGEHNE